jgi:hypothetical protein
MNQRNPLGGTRACRECGKEFAVLRVAATCKDQSGGILPCIPDVYECNKVLPRMKGANAEDGAFSTRWNHNVSAHMRTQLRISRGQERPLSSVKGSQLSGNLCRDGKDRVGCSNQRFNISLRRLTLRVGEPALRRSWKQIVDQQRNAHTIALLQ